MAKRGAAVKLSSKKGGRPEDELAAPVEPSAADASARPAAPRAPGKAASKVAVKKVATITITDIGDHLAATFDIPKSHAKIYLSEAVALIGKQLKKGSKVRLSGLGTLQVKKRAARKARNPNTGEEMKVKAGKRVVFAAAQDLKAKL